MKQKILFVLSAMLMLTVCSAPAFADVVDPPGYVRQSVSPWMIGVLIAVVVIAAAVILIKVLTGRRK